jgi:hypothetical protein
MKTVEFRPLGDLYSSLIGQWLRVTFALTYLDPAEIGDCFVVDLFETMPKDVRFEK